MLQDPTIPSPILPGAPGSASPILPIVSAPELGVPPLPSPPTPPALPTSEAPRGLLQQLIRSLPGIAGGFMGPGAGTGLLQGTVLGQARQAELERERYEDALRQHHVQQQTYNQQAQQYEIATRQRDQLLQSNLTNLRSQLKAARTPREYDAFIDAYANGLRGLGFRLDATWLRAAVPPFVPIDEREQAGAIFDDLLKNPLNADTFKRNPDLVLNGTVNVDLNGDGTPERMTLAELGLKGNRLLPDVNGRAIVMRENTPTHGDRFAQARENGLRLFREKNRRDPTADEDRTLLEEAISFARIGSTSEFDEYVARREQELGRKLTAGEYRGARQQFNQSDVETPALVQRQARQALKAAMLRGGPVSRAVWNQLTTAKLDPQVEASTIREEFMRAGRQLDPYATDVETLIETGRAAMAGSRQFEPEPADPAAMEALRRAFPGKLPASPRQPAVQPAAPSQPLTPGTRYRWTPQGLVPVE
jgi:hypothetical protein